MPSSPLYPFGYGLSYTLFQRVALDAGESKSVSLRLTPEDLMLLDLDRHWSVVPLNIRYHGEWFFREYLTQDHTESEAFA
jgi:hypothetical protein